MRISIERRNANNFMTIDRRETGSNIVYFRLPRSSEELLEMSKKLAFVSREIENLYIEALDEEQEQKCD